MKNSHKINSANSDPGMCRFTGPTVPQVVQSLSYGCARCGARNVIPLNSPVAQKFLAETKVSG
jgi:hypothetical protein